MGVTPIFIHKGAFSSKVKGVAQKIFRGLRTQLRHCFHEMTDLTVEYQHKMTDLTLHILRQSPAAQEKACILKW